MMFEGERAHERAGRAIGAQALEHGAVADVHAVEHADGQKQAGVGVIGVETADDLHLAGLHSLSTLSADSTRRTKVAGVANVAPLPCRSVSRTPRALEQAVQTWMRTLNS